LFGFIWLYLVAVVQSLLLFAINKTKYILLLPLFVGQLASIVVVLGKSSRGNCDRLLILDHLLFTRRSSAG